MKKLLALVFFSLLSASLWANMASPVQRGSATGLPYLSTYVRVLYETLKITPAADFKSCKFEVAYDIFADTSGISIPMLFVAEEYEGGMKIWVDGMPVQVYSSSEGGHIREISPLSQFNPDQLSGNKAVVEWDKYHKESYSIQDLHYFIFDLSKGGHQVRVEYTAKPWTDRSEWVIQEKFLYALSPARNWQSFGELEVILDASALHNDTISTNIGQPHSGSLDSVAKWKFDHLPEVPTLEVSIRHRVSGTTQALMNFGMEGFLWASGIFFALAHIIFMWLHRRRHQAHWFSWIWLFGSFAVPFLAMVVFLMSEGWINDALGAAASRRGGYHFLIFIFYPVALIGYGLVAKLIDHLLRKLPSR
jgi:hypothetical protein